MKIVIILMFIYSEKIRCEYVNSYTRSNPELPPTYDTTIYKDMVDVINEFDTKLNSGFDFNSYNDSEGEDNVDDLLSEYQHLLNKAQNQRMEVEKRKVKNNFPIFNHEKHIKDRNDQRYNYYSNNIYSPNSFPRTSLTKNSIKMTSPFDIPTVSRFQYPDTLYTPNIYDSKMIQNQRYPKVTTDDPLNDKLNINIKVDVKIPKVIETLIKLYNIIQSIGRPDKLLRDSSNVPFSYANNQIPSIFSFKPIYKHVFEPTKEITLYKKKKNRANKSEKKHKKKNIVTFHDASFDAISENYTQENGINIDDRKNNNTIDNITQQANSSTDILQNLQNNSSIPLSTTIAKLDNTENNTEPIYLLFNISSTTDNKMEDFDKIGNSIEKFDTAKTESYNIRLRREVTQVKNNNLKIKDSNKMSTIDDELLYWPTNILNSSVEIPKNIISLILERERKKAKLNITSDIMRNNHTVTLERAIFGEIDWDNMDAVVPVFISFIGKYLRGIVTFCSESICHSIKCAEKLCLHRVCKPQERFNVKGHCTGKINYTDSVAALESIMDLPSNIALETVDILEDKLKGKMFGKATLCISPKCVTFLALKKSFIKLKCTFRELLSTGHCPNMKIM